MLLHRVAAHWWLNPYLHFARILSNLVNNMDQLDSWKGEG